MPACVGKIRAAGGQAQVNDLGDPLPWSRSQSGNDCENALALKEGHDSSEHIDLGIQNEQRRFASHRGKGNSRSISDWHPRNGRVSRVAEHNGACWLGSLIARHADYLFSTTSNSRCSFVSIPCWVLYSWRI